jgi:hypothetical protein
MTMHFLNLGRNLEQNEPCAPGQTLFLSPSLSCRQNYIAQQYRPIPLRSQLLNSCDSIVKQMPLQERGECSTGDMDSTCGLRKCVNDGSACPAARARWTCALSSFFWLPLPSAAHGMAIVMILGGASLQTSYFSLQTEMWNMTTASLFTLVRNDWVYPAFATGYVHHGQIWSMRMQECETREKDDLSSS